MAVFDLKNGEIAVIELFGDLAPDALQDLVKLPLKFN
jgi:hypothetical protein